MFVPRRRKPPYCFTLSYDFPEVHTRRSSEKGRVKKQKNRTRACADFFGRSDRIRTCGLLVPNQAHYQAVPHPEMRFSKAKFILPQPFRFVKCFLQKDTGCFIFGNKIPRKSGETLTDGKVCAIMPLTLRGRAFSLRRFCRARRRIAACRKKGGAGADLEIANAEIRYKKLGDCI